MCRGRAKARKRKRVKEKERERAKAKVQRILRASLQETVRLRRKSTRMARMISRMRARWGSNEDERNKEDGGMSQHLMRIDTQELLDEVINKVVEIAEEKDGKCQTMRNKAEHRIPEKEALTTFHRGRVLYPANS